MKERRPLRWQAAVLRLPEQRFDAFKIVLRLPSFFFHAFTYP